MFKSNGSDKPNNVSRFLRSYQVACEKFSALQKDVVGFKRKPDFEYCKACFSTIEGLFLIIQCRHDDICRGIKAFGEIVKEYYEDGQKDWTIHCGAGLLQEARQLEQDFHVIYSQMKEQYSKSQNAIRVYKELMLGKRKTDDMMWLATFTDFDNQANNIGKKYKALEIERVSPLIKKLNSWVGVKEVEEQLKGKTFIQTENGWEEKEKNFN